ncbi:MAG: hypothetical protein CFE32_18385 [Alphaproteobacteria bacterium PA3]|nr:MAG: hypothetical protein CFE32_18385 [Alphaproteobacteria bacterium PA3]
MKAIPTPAFLGAAALLTAAPLAAQPTPEQADVIAAVDAFFAALRNPDKTALGTMMDPGGVISVLDKTGAGAPVERTIPVPKHLENWAKSPPGLDEHMIYTAVLVKGDEAQVSGPYRFTVNGKTPHCGVNVLSLVKTENGWKLGDTAFTMVPPSECEVLGAPEAPAP